jgi:hypothetical protein
MGIIKLPLRKFSKHTKFFCPHAGDSTFCLATCESEYVCELPKLVSKKRKTKPSFSKRFKKKEISFSSLEKQAERQLRWSHGEAGLV